MKLNFIVYYEDGSSGTGAHPESMMTINAALKEAQKTGKIAKSMARATEFGVKLVDKPIWEKK